MDRFLDVVTVASFVGIFLVLRSLRREHIRVEYSVSWLLAATLIFTLGMWRTLDQKLASLLGLSDVPTALVVTAGAIALAVLYRLSLRISGLKDSNIKLAQRVAILEFRLESLNEKVQTPTTN